MIKKQSVISQAEKTNHKYEITASLLNSWLRIWEVSSYGEDNIEQAKAEFLDTLYRKPSPDNEAMKKGREYEEDVYNGKDLIFSPIVKNGDFQTALKKLVKINGIDIVLYGKLDALKAGKIYDIKCVGNYQYLKYIKSAQHAMYLELVPEAKDFTYLIYDWKKDEHHFERYTRSDCQDIKLIISNFLTWLEQNNLLDTYKTYWNWDIKSHR